MTPSTNRYNIELVFRHIAFVMMIYLGWMFSILTLQSIGAGNFTSSNSPIYSTYSFSPFRVSNEVAFIFFLVSSFTFWCFLIFLNSFETSSFAFFSFVIFYRIQFLAGFAVALKSFSFAFVKFRSWFELLAFRTAFRYSLLKHYFLLNRKFCLEPVAGYAPAIGSSYYKGIK